MICRGQYEGGMIDYARGVACFSLCTKDRKALEFLKRDREYTVEIKPFHEVRTKDQNAYFHVMVGALAACMKTTTTYMKNHLVIECGAVGYERDTDGCIRTVIKPEGYPYMEDEDLHLVPISDCIILLPSGKKCKRDIYMVKKGTRMLDTAEFNALIEMTQEICKEHGIPTDPPEVRNYYEGMAAHAR